MLENIFPERLREFTRLAVSQAIDHCKTHGDSGNHIPGLLRELGNTYLVEAALREGREPDADQASWLEQWRVRGTSVL